MERKWAHPASNDIFGRCTDNGRNVDGEYTVPQQTHGLEESNIAAQQNDIEGENDCSHGQGAKDKLHITGYSCEALSGLAELSHLR